MDEQPHRRRRQRIEDPQQAPHLKEAVPQSEQKPKDEMRMQREAAATGDEQTHRRRRRAAEPQAEAQAAPQTEKPSVASKENEDVFWHPSDQQSKSEKKHKISDAKPIQAVAAVDDVICRIGDFCLAALKWTGVGLLFAAGFVVSGVKKLFGKALPLLRSTGKKSVHRSAVHTGKRIVREKKNEAAEADITLVPTRPEEYRGIGDKRSTGKRSAKPHHQQKKNQKRVVRAPRKQVSLVYSAAMAGFLCVALVSVYMIGSIVWRSISTKRLSDTLSQRYSELSSSAEAESGVRIELDDGGEAVYSADEPPQIVKYTDEAAEEQQEETAMQAAAQMHKEEVVRTTKFHQVGGDALPEMEALYQDNRDLIGWLRMEGILDLPVVYRDNEYYLTRDFYKNKSASGTLFLDENHPFKEKTQNLLLHGHNMKDGTMFGRLVQYETNLQFLKNNPFIQYSTLWQKEQYVIFAVLCVSLDVHSPEFFNYFTHPTFASDTQFESYVRALQNRSVFSIPVDVDPSDALLTLSTCLDEDRLVIVARRLREGESRSELRHLVQLADRQ